MKWDRIIPFLGFSPLPSVILSPPWTCPGPAKNKGWYQQDRSPYHTGAAEKVTIPFFRHSIFSPFCCSPFIFKDKIVRNIAIFLLMTRKILYYTILYLLCYVMLCYILYYTILYTFFSTGNNANYYHYRYNNIAQNIIGVSL